MSSGFAAVTIVAQDDPLYEAELSAGGRGGRSGAEAAAHLHQFVVHAALDMAEEAAWNTNSMYLKVVDTFNNLQISSWITASQVKFMLLHDRGHEDKIRLFFQAVHELYLKTLLNPFYAPGAPITSRVFDARVRAAARRYL